MLLCGEALMAGLVLPFWSLSLSVIMTNHYSSIANFLITQMISGFMSQSAVDSNDVK